LIKGVTDVADLSRRRVELTNRLGFHLRAASLFARLSNQFQAKVRVTCNGLEADGRSILDLMLLAAECGAHLELEASGVDSVDATAALCALVEARFLEEEEGGKPLPTPASQG
jgi:phosphocarrier protein